MDGNHQSVGLVCAGQSCGLQKPEQWPDLLLISELRWDLVEYAGVEQVGAGAVVYGF